AAARSSRRRREPTGPREDFPPRGRPARPRSAGPASLQRPARRPTRTAGSWSGTASSAHPAWRACSTPETRRASAPPRARVAYLGPASRLLTVARTAQRHRIIWQSPWRHSRQPGRPGRSAAHRPAETPSSVPATAQDNRPAATSSLPVADAVDGPRVVVAHEHRSVLEHEEVHRTTEIAVVLDEAGHESLDPRTALAVGPGHRDVGILLRAVPRTVTRDEHCTLVLGREHLAAIERQAQRAGMRTQEGSRLDIVVARLAPAEFRVGDVALVAERV